MTEYMWPLIPVEDIKYIFKTYKDLVFAIKPIKHNFKSSWLLKFGFRLKNDNPWDYKSNLITQI